MSKSTAFLLVVAGILGLLAVNAGDRLFKVLMRYRLLSLVWRLSRSVIFAAWAAAFMLLAAGHQWNGTSVPSRTPSTRDGRTAFHD